MTSAKDLPVECIVQVRRPAHWQHRSSSKHRCNMYQLNNLCNKHRLTFGVFSGVKTVDMRRLACGDSKQHQVPGEAQGVKEEATRVAIAL